MHVNNNEVNSCFRYFLHIRAEKEYALLSKQLQSELDDKKSIINQLSKQLEIHQKNFDELKEELNNVCTSSRWLGGVGGGGVPVESGEGRELLLHMCAINYHHSISF